MMTPVFFQSTQIHENRLHDLLLGLLRSIVPI